MIKLHKRRAIGVGIAVAALVVPAAASAHPSVYVTSAPTDCAASGDGLTPAAYLATCTQQTRYVFTNHGNTYLLRESNGKTSGGAISYAHRPGGAAGLGATSGFDLFGLPPAGPTTGAQPHATCDVPALTTAAVIRSWQGSDPFYAYVPFQRTAVGVDDHAAGWLGVVQTATGVDLGAIADTDAARKAACEALPGASAGSYVPADATQSSLASWSSGQVHVATAPLEEEIGQQSAAIGAWQTVDTTNRTQLRALEAQIAQLHLALRRLQISLPATIPSRSVLVGKGMALGLAGPAGRTVRARLKISRRDANTLHLRSVILASRRVTLDVAGNATFDLRPTSTVGARLKKASNHLQVAVDAASGDRYTIASARLAG